MTEEEKISSLEQQNAMEELRSMMESPGGKRLLKKLEAMFVSSFQEFMNCDQRDFPEVKARARIVNDISEFLRVTIDRGEVARDKFSEFLEKKNKTGTVQRRA